MFGLIGKLFASIGITVASIFSFGSEPVESPVARPTQTAIVEEAPESTPKVIYTTVTPKPTVLVTPSTPKRTQTPAPIVTFTPTPTPFVLSQSKQNYLRNLLQEELDRINYERQWNEEMLNKKNEIIPTISALVNELSVLEEEQEQAIQAVYNRSLSGAVLRSGIESEIYNIETGRTTESYKRLKRMDELKREITKNRQLVFYYESQMFIDPPASRYNCDNFYSWEEANFVFNLPGYRNDPFDLDRDNDGIPCEHLK